MFEGSPAAMARFLHCCRQQIDSVSSCYRAELDLEGGDDPKRLSVTLQSIPGCQNLEFPCARFDNLKWRQLPIMLVLGSRCRCRSFNLLSDVCGIQRGHGRATHRRRQPAETGSNWCQRTGLHNRQYHGPWVEFSERISVLDTCSVYLRCGFRYVSRSGQRQLFRSSADKLQKL